MTQEAATLTDRDHLRRYRPVRVSINEILIRRMASLLPAVKPRS